MTAIYEKVVLSWKGKEYEVQPSFAMVQLIEGDGVSILGVIKGYSEGQPLASHMGIIVAHMLHSGGARGVVPADIYAYLAHCSRAEWLTITTAITIAFLPQEPEPGNSEALGDGGNMTTKAETEPETART